MPEVKRALISLFLHLFYQDIKLCADTVNGRKARFLKVAVKLPKEDPSGQLTTMVEMFEQPGLFFCVRNLPLNASSSLSLSSQSPRSQNMRGSGAASPPASPPSGARMA